MSKILLGEKSSGCSDLDFLEVEATLPVEQNVGGPAITDDTCVSLGTFILVPCPGSGPLLRATLQLQTGHDYTGIEPWGPLTVQRQNYKPKS